MKVQSISSGSSGNCVYVESDQACFLVDAGKSGRQIQEILQAAGIDPRRLDGIFVTHEHADHIQGVGVLSRRFRIPVFANENTWGAMAKRLGRIAPNHRIVFRNDQSFEWKGLEVRAIPIHHDAVDPVGYTFTSREEKATILTDTGFLDDRIMDRIADSNIFYLEANHDVAMLLNGPYPEPLKERVLSNQGHLSNRQAGLALASLLRGEDEAVLLAHLSEENNTPEISLATVRAVLMEEGIDPDRGITIKVAPRHVASRVYTCRYHKERCSDAGDFSPDPVREKERRG